MTNFTIAVDGAQAMVRVSLNGFLSVADVAAFAAELKSAYLGLGARLGTHRTFVDISECRIQPQEVVEAFRVILNNPVIMSRKLAFTTGDSPARMQIRRLINRESARFFFDKASAEAWLMASEQVPLAGSESRAALA